MIYFCGVCHFLLKSNNFTAVDSPSYSQHVRRSIFGQFIFCAHSIRITFVVFNVTASHSFISIQWIFLAWREKEMRSVKAFGLHMVVSRKNSNSKKVFVSQLNWFGICKLRENWSSSTEWVYRSVLHAIVSLQFVWLWHFAQLLYRVYAIQFCQFTVSPFLVTHFQMASTNSQKSIRDTNKTEKQSSEAIAPRIACSFSNCFSNNHTLCGMSQFCFAKKHNKYKLLYFN